MPSPWWRSSAGSSPPSPEGAVSFLLGAEAVNASVMHASKLGAYVGLGAFAWKYLLYGLCAGIASILAAWLGKRVLGRMPAGLFRRLVVSVMVAAGGLMIWSERTLLRGLGD